MAVSVSILTLQKSFQMALHLFYKDKHQSFDLVFKNVFKLKNWKIYSEVHVKLPFELDVVVYACSHCHGPTTAWDRVLRWGRGIGVKK